MIISHKFKFIFIKPTKVAGTSIEAALAKSCGASDIITPIKEFSASYDDVQHFHPARNYKRFFNHITPIEIKQRIGASVWDEYKKITVVRNPWDLVVSRFFWEKASYETEKITVHKLLINLFNLKAYKTFFRRRSLHKGQISFEDFVSKFDEKWTNTRYYFNENSEPICDYYIRYENLENDYQTLCLKLNIPYEKLPRLKTKSRKKKMHYSEYYNEFTREHISKIFKKDIEFFNYTFDHPVWF